MATLLVQMLNLKERYWTVDVAIAPETIWGAGGDTRFNLIANPYPSYLNANSNAGTNNVFSNLNVLQGGTHQAIWYWDGAANSGSGAYGTITNATAAKYMAPGQAFMVSAKGDEGDSGTFSFTTTMQILQDLIFMQEIWW